MRAQRAVVIVAILAVTCLGARPVPRPLQGHPGNIFLEGENVRVQLAPQWRQWTLHDYEGKPVNSGRGPAAVLGKLPIGYYEFRSPQQSDRITLGVIAPLAAPTPADSPISLDVALAWLVQGEVDQRAAANLCTLAGANWVRDRLVWHEIESEPGKFTTQSRSDLSVAIQAQAQLRVLQLNHRGPPWDAPEVSRFPNDLRNVYRFYRVLAERWRGAVQAFEPWNEADIETFGGHLGCEIASLQKVAYLALKAGNPDIIVCQNVFAFDNTDILADLDANETWPYFETYNLHHYVPLERFAGVYANHRSVSAGRPMWVTECSMPVAWQGDEALQEPGDADLRIQAERVAPVYASSVYHGSVNTFYFILPHYVEGQIQYGILRRDLTPRPAYVALAAVGRLLAGAKPLGRWKSDDPQIEAYLFRARPDGKQKLVMVAWRHGEAAPLKIDAPTEAVLDHLGRPARAASLSAAPLFVVFSGDPGSALPLEPPPQPPPPRKSGKVSPIVLQPILSREQVDQPRSACAIPPQGLTFCAYNFGTGAAEVRPKIEAPADWTVTITPPSQRVSRGGRAEFRLFVARDPTDEIKTIRIAAADAVLSLRVSGSRNP